MTSSLALVELKADQPIYAIPARKKRITPNAKPSRTATFRFANFTISPQLFDERESKFPEIKAATHDKATKLQDQCSRKNFPAAEV